MIYSDENYLLTADGATTNYTYDKLHRLTGETSGGVYPQVGYTYNGIGNITQKTLGTSTFSYAYDPNHKHAVKTVTANGTPYSYTYDQVGNMLGGPDFTNPANIASRSIYYYADNLPATIQHSISGVTDFVYDGLGNRVIKQVPGGGKTFYIGDHFELKDGVATKYIFAGNLRVAKVTPSGRNYFHKDHLSSSSAMTDATGAVIEMTEYQPFGDERDHAGTVVTDYKFTDQELDTETGLYNYDARHYDAVIGRFVSADPTISDAYDPQLLNRYAYVRNNPLRYTDPTGRYGVDVHYYLSYTLSVLAGFSPKEAQIIATANQYVDDNPATSTTSLEGSSLAEGLGNRNQKAQEYHFNPDKGEAAFDQAIASQSLEKLGISLHARADSEFSHEKMIKDMAERISKYRTATGLPGGSIDLKNPRIKQLINDKTQRYTQEWLFENNGWYLRDFWELEGESCKGLPIVFLNITTEKLGLKTIKISWETDEAVESKITYSTWGGVSGKPIKKTVRLPGLKKRHEAVLTDLIFSASYAFDIGAKRGKRECNSNFQTFMTGGLAELEFSKIWLKLILWGKTGEEIFLKVKEDAAKGAGSTFLEVDAIVAQRIANEGWFVFPFGFDKSGEVPGLLAAPELPEIKKEAEEKSRGCKGTLIILVAPALSLYAECLYDYTKMIPKYYVERSTLSDIAKKHGKSIEKEEDVIEWLKKTDHKR